MMSCGLLGQHLGHSYSPLIHKMFADYTYNLFEIQPDRLDEFMRCEHFSGINVTIPYKKAVIPYCNNLTDAARSVGAVNTVVRNSDGNLVGHNTDLFGFSSMLMRTGITVAGKKALVLGSGGASVTVCAVLRSFGANVTVISRKGPDNYTNLYNHYDATLIVNTTPVGMFPNTDNSPLDLQPFSNLEGVLDLIYNPARTKLLQQAESLGLIAENGLFMLVAQAKESAEWFTGKKISDDLIVSTYESLRRRSENIILIGMPGCGKTTIGKLLAEKTGCEFIDADAYLAQVTGQSASQIIKETGENVFRAIETKVLSDLGKQSGVIIATGGGCVTRQENYFPLHQNGKIVWIHRNIDLLPTDGRPLSIANDLHDLYRSRCPLYDAFADVCIENDTSAEETAEKILSKLR